MTALQLLMFLAVLIIVKAQPTCRTRYTSQVICTGDKVDYVLQRGLVSDNNNTTRIRLKSCKISDVENEAFNNLTALKYLDLSQNKIEKLNLGVFDETKLLIHLNLSYNQITLLPLGLFDQVTHITYLDLKGNKMNKLELGIFDKMRRLRYLDLSDNDFAGRELNPNLFNYNPHIAFIDFSRNDMIAAPESLLHAFQSLEVLHLDGCFLNEIPEFAIKSNMKTLKRLVLSTNQISNLENETLFQNLENLEVLDLSYNIIGKFLKDKKKKRKKRKKNIDGDIFKPLRKIQKILLNNNKVKIMHDNLFRNLPKLTEVDLSENKIEEVPVNVFKGSPLTYLNLSNNKITYLPVNFCLELLNSGGKLKKFIFEPNPWQCACLMEQLKELKRLGIEYNSARYNGKNLVCLTATEFICVRNPNVIDMYVDKYRELTGTGVSDVSNGNTDSLISI